MNETPLSRLIANARRTRERGLCARLDPAEGPDGPGDRFGFLRVSGSGAAAFLDGQLSNEAASLAPGEGNASARVTRMGALTHLLTLHRLPGDESFAIILEREGLSALKADLERYLFDETVAIADDSDAYRWVLLLGPRVPDALRRAWGEAAFAGEPPAKNGVCRRPWRGLPEGSLLVRRALAGEELYFLLVPKLPSHEDGIHALAEAAAAEGMLLLSGMELAELREALRIEAGLPRLGVDLAPGKELLPATGLEAELVRRSQGCYLGQEIIARLKSRGSAPLALRGLVLCDAQGEACRDSWEDALRNLPDPGSPLLDAEGRTLGHVGSGAFSPGLSAPVALALLDREHRAPGRVLTLQGKRDDFRARIVVPPFVAIEDGDLSAESLYDLAVHRFADRRDDEAIGLLERALRKDPTFAEAYEALGVILGRSERYEEAVALFARLEPIAPDEPMVNTNLSLYHMKLGHKELAEEEKAKATVKQFRSLAGARAREARESEAAENRRREAERKIGMFREVLEIDPEDPLALGGLGQLLAELGRWPEAEPALAKACGLQPDNAALFEQRGRVLEKLGRTAEAREIYAQGIEAAARKGSLMPLRKMEQRLLLLGGPESTFRSG